MWWIPKSIKIVPNRYYINYIWSVSMHHPHLPFGFSSHSDSFRWKCPRSSLCVWGLGIPFCKKPLRITESKPLQLLYHPFPKFMTLNLPRSTFMPLPSHREAVFKQSNNSLIITSDNYQSLGTWSSSKKSSVASLSLAFCECCSIHKSCSMQV